jgi:2,5-dihydroxypyridine 5,6-dioxygenase
MAPSLHSEEFGDIVIQGLVRPEPGDALLVLADANDDQLLAKVLLDAGIRAGADAQLIVKPVSATQDLATKPGPILSEAIRASRLILSICDDGIDASKPMLEARANGTRALFCAIAGVEDYVMRGLLNVDVDSMLRNVDRVVDLWHAADHCRVTSPEGTDVEFRHGDRKCKVGDGALTEDGEIDFFPGAQVSIAPLEETINGTIVIDASDSVQGIVREPYSFTVEKGVVISVDGGVEADTMRQWFESCGQPAIYELCHFSIGLNPEAGISGHMIEDERKLAAVDFGFGYQNPTFGGAIGPCDFHMDIMLSTPTIYLDGVEMSGGGRLNPELGFEQRA